MTRLALTLLLASCGGAQAAQAGTTEDVAPEPGDDLWLVESWPSETTLDHPEIPDAHEVWVEMIDAAETRLDFLEFYGVSEEGSRLEPVIAAVERAAERGVQVRFVFDAMFYRNEHALPDRLRDVAGVEVRIYEFPGGGVQHTKLFVVDDREVFVGSHNFDWRSLEHVLELGVRVRQPALVAAMRRLFELDWSRAGGVEPPVDVRSSEVFPVASRFRGAPVQVTPAQSPRGQLPDETLWDWPMILEAIETARRRVRLQVMSYHLRGHSGEEWRGVDDALRAAAARGVSVELLVSNWEQRPDRIGDLQALSEVENIEVRIATIPQHSSGFIPFARTIHAKYLTVDGEVAWIGTSDASGDYFLHSRNAGFFVRGSTFASALDDFFEGVWNSEYAADVDPDREYEAPRIAE